MQQVVNVLASLAFAMSASEVVLISYVVHNQDKYRERVREEIIEEVSTAIPEIIERSIEKYAEGKIKESLSNDNPLDNLINGSTPFR